MRELDGESGPWGVLAWTKNGQQQQHYQITDLDVLWGCRMIVGEGPDEALEVLQCMAQRFAFVGAWSSLHELYLKYSQPINPKWRRDGSGCRGKVGQSGCEEHRLARRDRLARATLDELRREQGAASAEGIADALAWFRGQATTGKVRGAVHFAIKPIVLNHVGGDPDSPLIVLKGRNWFSAVPGTRHWSVAAVSVLPPGGRGAAPAPPMAEAPEATTYKDAIIDLQRALSQAGHDPGPIDGVLGQRTWRALEAARGEARAIEAAAAAANLDGEAG